ncbi:MAG: L,D-transpeptidase family protein [Anaerolineae bacterium]
MTTQTDPIESDQIRERGPESPPDSQRRYAHPLVGVLAILLGLSLGLAILYALLRGAQRLYAERILPNSYALGIDLSGLTLDQATALLSEASAPPYEGMLLLDAGDRIYEVPWHDAGMLYSPRATAKAALRLGHEPADLHPRRWLRLLQARHDIPPVYELDPDLARELLTMAAPALAVKPGPSMLSLEESNVTVVPGEPGRQLAIEATLANIVGRASEGDPAQPVAMVFRDVPPASIDISAIQDQVDDMVSREIIVETYDLVQDRTYRWQLGHDTLVSWITLHPLTDEQGNPTAVKVAIAESAVAATVQRLSDELGDDRGFRPQKAIPALMAAHSAGGGTVTLYLSHSPGSYAVISGDTAEAIASRHGMPLWALQQANPNVDLEALRIGQELVIPSQDVLTPLMPVPEKRIVVSVSQRRLRAYENKQLLWDWPVAVGRESSPTQTGAFQVLDKQESAYASLWDLHMPHFIAVYEAGPGFYNGIHGLPLLSSGYRLWEGALGTDASYGCIVLGTDEAAQLYQWAEPGVPVIIEP